MGKCKEKTLVINIISCKIKFKAKGTKRDKDRLIFNAKGYNSQ